MTVLSIDAVEAALRAAEDADRPAERFVAAYHAALHVAALVLAARRPRLRGRFGAWQVVARVEPVLGEWAAYFDALQLTCRAVEAGATGVVGERQADDLVRDVRAFRESVAALLAARYGDPNPSGSAAPSRGAPRGGRGR